jgi:hypothetical protein
MNIPDPATYKDIVKAKPRLSEKWLRDMVNRRKIRRIDGAEHPHLFVVAHLEEDLARLSNQSVPFLKGGAR